MSGLVVRVWVPTRILGQMMFLPVSFPSVVFGELMK